MSMLILLAFLLGAVLGMRFKVFILIPAIGIRFDSHPRGWRRSR